MIAPPDPHPIHGQCLCGTVHLRATLASRHLDACHCSMCRTWGGGPLLSLSVGTTLKVVQGWEEVVRYASSDWAERGFCALCGTHLFYHFKPMDTYACPAGLFPETEGLALTCEIFIDEQPAYYTFAEPTVRKTGAQVIAEIKSSPSAGT